MPKSREFECQPLWHAYNQWWVVSEGKMIRRATDREIKKWMVLQLLQDLPAV